MVGLHSGTHSRIVVLAGILTIAIADAFSDALGIHVSEEADNTHTAKQIWGATIATFLTKFLVAMTFVVPVLFLSLSTAIVVNLIWGMSILSVLSYIIAKSQGEPPWKIVGEHPLPTPPRLRVRTGRFPVSFKRHFQIPPRADYKLHPAWQTGLPG
jgi:VIT1/CCC1 family predicted Fe2+/Mn2+ transporter